MSKLIAVTLKHLDIGDKVVPGSIGLLRLEPLELSSNLVDLVLDVGVSGHLHREYKVQEQRVIVKRLSQLFLISLRLTTAAGSW